MNVKIRSTYYRNSFCDRGFVNEQDHDVFRAHQQQMISKQLLTFDSRRLQEREEEEEEEFAPFIV